MRGAKLPDTRRGEIVQAALMLFTERGYKNTSVKDITECAQVAQGLFHYYFETKERVLAEVIGMYNQNLIARLNVTDIFPESLGAVGKVNRLLEALFSYVKVNSELLKEFAAIRDSSVSDGIIVSLAESISRKFMEIVEQGNSEGVFNCSAPGLVTEIYIFGFVAHFKKEISLRGRFVDFSDYFRENLDVYLEITMRLLGMKERAGLFDFVEGEHELH